MAVKWEYRLEPKRECADSQAAPIGIVKPFGTNMRTVARFNELGVLGWEYVGTLVNDLGDEGYLFKRPVASS